MTVTPLAAFLGRLDQAARNASANEDAMRKEILRRLRELEDGRAFAYRRLNLMRSVAGAVADAKDSAEAAQKGADVLRRDLGWSGGNEAQKQVMERFGPVAVAAWTAREGGEDPEGKAVESELAAFESWFAEARGTSLLAALGQEVVELPLVEVS